MVISVKKLFFRATNINWHFKGYLSFFLASLILRLVSFFAHQQVGSIASTRCQKGPVRVSSKSKVRNAQQWLYLHVFILMFLNIDTTLKYALIFADQIQCTSTVHRMRTSVNLLLLRVGTTLSWSLVKFARRICAITKVQKMTRNLKVSRNLVPDSLPPKLVHHS